MVVSHNSLDGTPSVLTTKTGAAGGDNGRWSSYELPEGFDWDLGGAFFFFLYDEYTPYSHTRESRIK